MGKLVKRLINICKYSERRFDLLVLLGFFRRTPDNQFLRKMFKNRMKEELNLENPKTFNEKLQWLKLYDRRPEYTMMVDKYAVRKHIAETIGEEYLIPLLGVWERAEDIDFDKLPDQFVLKCNHNSGGLCICTDKSQLDILKVRKGLNKALKQDYYLAGREWPYKNVPRRIIAEKYMVDESGTELKDYKVFCFNGEPKIIQVDFNRNTSHRKNLYDIEWNLLNLEFNYPSKRDIIIDRPMCLEDMLKYAKKLSSGIPYLRVDFYSIYDKLYFGELTFFPASGFGRFVPDKWDTMLGEWLQLPDENLKS